jgi:hypothetical protein
MNSTLLALDIIPKLVHLLLEEGVVLFGGAYSATTHYCLRI